MRRFCLSAFLLACLSSGALAQASTGQVTAFFPKGVAATLGPVEPPVVLASGVSRELPAGTYQFLVEGLESEPYRQSLVVASGAEVVLLPRLQPSSFYKKRLVATLTEKQAQARALRAVVLGSAALSGLAAMAGWATVGGLEWVLATKKSDLVAQQNLYRAASGAEAPMLWSKVEELKTQIGGYRAAEGYALAGASLFSAGTLGLLLVSPDPAEFDAKIKALESPSP